MMRRIFLISVLVITIVLFTSVIALAPTRGSKKEPLPSSNFLVEIEGITSAQFTHVEGIGSETEVVEYREGGEANEVKVIPGLTRTTPIILKRILSDNEELWDWFESNRDDPVDTRGMSIIVLNRGREEQVRYNFVDCWPSAYYIEPLDSNPSDVAIEVIVIECDSMERASR